ncbi:MAG: hypothetical protein D4R94_02295 [Chitinophagaceae bacterium]|jgi:hypothetical protein|nr:MAG: hypothetical protein D4R94_02295 [Chitinophagaceae bacterium]
MENNTPPKVVKYIGNFISYIFHPLFIPTYFLLYLIQNIPYEFAGITPWQLQLRVFSVFWLTAFFPAFSVFLLWKLKFSDSIYLRTQKERIIPYVITMFFYWWMYYLSRHFNDQPLALKYFYFGIFIASAIGLIINNFIKVSLHGIGVGGILMAVILAGIMYPIQNIFWVSIAIVITSLVMSARMMVSNHTNKELWIGLMVGAATQTIAYFWVL